MTWCKIRVRMLDRCALRALLVFFILFFSVASRFLCKAWANTRGQIPDMEAESNWTIFNNKAGDSNFLPPARVYSLLIYETKSIYYYFSKQRNQVGLYVPHELFVWRTFWGGTIKVQQLADQIVVIPNRQRSLSMRPLPSRPSQPGKELWGGGRGEKKTSSRDENHLKTFNCNPDAICGPLVRPRTTMWAPWSASLETCAPLERCAPWLTSVTLETLYTRSNSLLMCCGLFLFTVPRFVAPQKAVFANYRSLQGQKPQNQTQKDSFKKDKDRKTLLNLKLFFVFTHLFGRLKNRINSKIQVKKSLWEIIYLFFKFLSCKARSKIQSIFATSSALYFIKVWYKHL